METLDRPAKPRTATSTTRTDDLVKVAVDAGRFQLRQPEIHGRGLCTTVDVRRLI